ncbi:MAG: Response regulator containing CheY-like receiver domain and AraC-type DNA-binding domain [Herbinix sp.]|nr:Response regulator containing CheY-like receiver domain and AraC-type DNA-binding domain [Herbinix sp.]
MKILIIDDEKLTREGIISNIDWKRLGIQEIQEADDGINGVKQAKLHKPDIILSDVRMPRMNGIDMCRELLHILPNSSIIFMSGYSDKEYLKAAISLKAISYVEKPIEASEIEAAIINAIHLQKIHAKNQATFHTHNEFMQNKLSLEIIYTPLKKSVTEYLVQFQELGITLKTNTEFTTLIITLKKAISSIAEHVLNELYLTIGDIIKKYRMNYIFGIKNDEYIILHLFSNGTTVDYNLNGICSSLSTYLGKEYYHYISIGKTVHGIQNVYQSYNTAVVLMQCSFFYDYNSIITSSENTSVPINFDNNYALKFEEALKFNDQEKVCGIVFGIYNSLKNNQSLLPNNSKDLYYKLFILLQNFAASHHISLFNEEYNSTILDNVSKCDSLTELNQLLLDKIECFYSALQTEKKENATIFAIKEFISKNYSNDNLSVKDISEDVFLSSTYVCTIFKNETGKTLNQYLTEYRIEKAKNMLKDFRYKITDISAKVGYSDGNYFGKAFKKLVGLSPSEYRERFGK